ncbi:MAG: hypothetical protein HKL98_04650 [Burkholderiales bacterium]|nr:hypothetical protein [Burkholderiales bacterium]
MDHGNVYIRTELGEKELGNRDLTLELNEILSRIDGRSSVRDLMAGASFWSAETFDAAIEELLELGYIAPVTPAEEKIEEFEVVPEIAPAAVERQRITGKSKFSQTERTLISTVLFLDIVEYTRKSVADQFKIKGQFNRLLAELLQKIPEDDRIVIDTGDGAAIGFLADPEEVLHIAIRMRDALEANDHKDYPGLYVRMGINLGPVKLVTDMNGRENLIGDGVNDANRVMGFAKGDQILISRPFYDVVSRLSSEQQGLFSYQGIHRDKHRREHEIYEVAGGNRVRAEEENRREEKSEEQIRAERLDKMKAKLEAAARSEVESKAAMLAHEQARAAAEEEMRRKAAAARMAAEQTRVRKKSGNGGLKFALIALAALLVILIGVLPFIPLGFVAKSAISSIADRTQESVAAETGRFSLLPTPRIILKGVTVGQNLKIGKMTEILSLSGSKAMPSVLMEDVNLDQDVLAKLPEWGGQPFALKMQFRNVSLSLWGKILPSFDAAIDFSEDGSFGRASIASAGMKAQILADGKVDVSAKSWSIPLVSDAVWDDVTASGSMGKGEFRVNSMSGTGFGGEWSGSAVVSWPSGWQAHGSIKGKNLDLDKLMPGFSAAKTRGTLEFNAEWASASSSFSGLFDSPEVKANFAARNGSLGGVDFAQAIRSPSPEGARGGETNFDVFTGVFSRSGQDFRMDRLRLDSGILKAQGSLVIRAGALSGQVSADLDRVHSNLSLGGTLSDPVVR